MKTLYTFIAIIFLYSSVAYADHVSGADITYKCLGGNTYEVNLNFYRDCKGAAQVGGCNLTFGSNCTSVSGGSCSGGPYPVYFSYYSPSCHVCVTDTFSYSTAVVTVVSPVCSSMISTCNGGVVAGMERWSFKKTITLPSQCSDWTFIYGNFARNTSLTAINNPSGSGFGVYTTLNNLAAPCNSSPSFSTPNITYICSGHQYCFNEGTIELNGDSIVYSLVQPKKGVVFSNDYVNYISGYSYTNPFGSASPITFNPANGSFCVTPATTMVTVMTVKASEYRNGVLIGSVERDMEFVVVACNNDNPAVSGINGTPYSTANSKDSICAGTQLCFNVTGSDPNGGDSLTMTWDNAISGATFNVTGTAFSPSGQFCWTPSLSDVRSAPYPFTVKIHDNACPYQGVQYFPFNIYVKNCASAGPKAIFYSSDTTFCNESGQCIDFFDISTGSPTTWKWSFPGAIPDTSTMKNPTGICYTVPGSYSVKLVVTNSGGSDSSFVSPLIIFGSGAAIPVLTISHDTVFCSHESAYQWYCNGSPVSGEIDSFFVVTSCATCQSINVYITDDLGCSRLGNPIICAGVNELNGNSGMIIYPNPVKEELWVMSDGLWVGTVKIEIINVLGETVLQSEIKNHKSEIQIDVSSLAKGVYTIRLINNDKIYFEKNN